MSNKKYKYDVDSTVYDNLERLYEEQVKDFPTRDKKHYPILDISILTTRSLIIGGLLLLSYSFFPLSSAIVSMALIGVLAITV